MTYYCKMIPCEEKEGYWLKFPDFYSCSEEGNTKEQVLERGKKALEYVLLFYLDRDLPIPNPTDYHGVASHYPIVVDEELAQRILESKKKIAVNFS